MAQNEPSKAEKSSQPNFVPPELVRMGENYVEQLLKIKTEMFDRLQETNQSWFARVQLEADLASQLRAKLTAARSIPETATAYQEWGSRRTELAAEDTRRILADGQKLMETGARWLSNGWLSNGHAGKP